MKKLLLIISLLSSNSFAGILEAEIFYDQKNYKSAYKEYEKLAKLGNIRAQYNIAIMLFNGQGTDTQSEQAYAWTIVAGDQDPTIVKLTNLIAKDLNANQIMAAQKLAEELSKKYSNKNSKTLLGAIESDHNKNQYNGYYFKPTKSIFNQFKYPNKAVGKGGRGWVDISYNIYPDGSARDFNIFDQFPKNHNHFVDATIEHFSKIKYEIYKQSKRFKPKTPIYQLTRAKFGIQNIGSLGRANKKKINEILKPALAGDLNAQYYYTQLYYSFLNYGGGVSQKVINQWLLRSAQFGLKKAQLRLGRNIFYGERCKMEQQKGFDWILRAAENNVANAQYLAYDIITNYPLLNNFTNKPALYWLKKSARNHSNIGQITYAKYLLNQDNLTTEDLKIINSLITEYAKSIPDTIDIFLTKAKLYEKQGDFKQAKKFNEKAHKIAKKLDIEL